MAAPNILSPELIEVMLAQGSTRLENPVAPFGKEVILELKFTDRFPDWFGELVRVFSLVHFSAAKYAEGVAVLGEQGFHDGYATRNWQQNEAGGPLQPSRRPRARTHSTKHE